MPTHVLPISCWMSPWFQANPGSTHSATPVHGFDVWKKKSGLPNIVNVGVRFGSALIMCSVFSSTGSASACVSGTVCTAPPLRTYGSSEVSPPTSARASRTAASVGPGWPLT